VSRSAEQLRAFDHLADQLRGSVTVSARALARHQDEPVADLLDQHIDHTLERLAGLHRRATENLTLSALFGAVIHGEAHLAHAHAHAQGIATAGASRRATVASAHDLHRRRAQLLIDAARRARNLRVSSVPPVIVPWRGVYVAPFTPAARALLVHDCDDYSVWRDGAVATVRDEKIEVLRALGAEVIVLFLSADELYELAARRSRAELTAEFDRRLALATDRAATGGQELFEHHVRRLLFGQNNVLRSLAPRLGDQHAACSRAVAPIVAEHRQLLAVAVAADDGAPAGLAAVVAAERETQAVASRLVAVAEQDDAAGLLRTFRSFVAAGTLLPELVRAGGSR
jgi:hypothetical protein